MADEHDAALDAAMQERRARDAWPYISEAWKGARNGRELGAWLAGFLIARYDGRTADEQGVRVAIPEPLVAGVAAVCLETGMLIARYKTEGSAPQTWVYDVYLDPSGL